MAGLYKKADWWDDVKNYVSQNADVITPAAIGTVGGGALGYLTTGMLWNNPNWSQKLLLTALGAAVGGGGSAAIADALRSYRQDRASQFADTAKASGSHLVRSISGDRPDKKQQEKMTPFQKALYGRTDTGSVGDNVLGWGVRQVKKSLPSTHLSTAENIFRGGANVAGFGAGYYYTGKAIDPFYRKLRYKQLLSEASKVYKHDPALGISPEDTTSMFTQMQGHLPKYLSDNAMDMYGDIQAGFKRWSATHDGDWKEFLKSKGINADLFIDPKNPNQWDTKKLNFWKQKIGEARNSYASGPTPTHGWKGKVVQGTGGVLGALIAGRLASGFQDLIWDSNESYNKWSRT